MHYLTIADLIHFFCHHFETDGLHFASSTMTFFFLCHTIVIILLFFIRRMIYRLILSLLWPQGNWSFLTVVILSFSLSLFVFNPLYHTTVNQMKREREKGKTKSYIYFSHHTAISLSVFRWHLALFLLRLYLRKGFFRHKQLLPIHLSAHVPMFVFLIGWLSSDLCWQ